MGLLHKREELLRYQNAGVQFIKDTKRCALFIDMGLGKTITVLTAIADLQAELELGRVLVVGPPRVVKKTWPDEIKDWEHTRKHFTYTSLQASPKVRQKRLREATDIHLISSDLVEWLDRETCGEHDYDMIVIDESSLFKSQKSKRWKAMRRLVAHEGCRYLLELSGTPAPNGLHDLWGQIYLIDRGARLGHTESDFKKRWFTEPEWGSEHAKPKPKSFAQTKIKERIEDICFTLLDKDYATLPPRMDNKVLVEMDDEMTKRYKKFVREYVLEITDGVNVNAVSAGALTQKLQQFANGSIIVGDPKDNRVEHLHRLKLDALHDIVEEANGEPMIVAYSHRADIARIKAEFPYAVTLGGDPKTIDQWNEGRLPMLIMHPKSGGHGLNMQFGGHILTWYGLTWSLELYQQLNKRIHRRGQARPCMFHHILTEGTIDMTVMSALVAKDQTQSSFLDSLRRIIVDEYRKAA